MGSGGPRTDDDGLDPLTEPTDADLLQTFRSGDVGTFRILYERHRPAATRFARGLAASEFAANDAVSEAFLRVYSALSNGGGPADAFRAYLFSAIRSAVVDDVRRTSRMRYTDDLEPFEDSTEPTDVNAVQEDREFISRAFAGLTDQWKQVLWLTSVEGRRHNEVAEILGLKTNAVAALALRAREGLRQNYLTAHLSSTPTRVECRRTVKNLAALVRSKISPRERAHAEDHLRGCRRCRVAAVMLTDLNRVMPAIALPALLAPAPWLVHLHAVTAGSGFIDSPAGGHGPSNPETAPGRHGTGRHSRLVRHPATTGSRVTSFLAAHTVAVVVATAAVVAAGGVAVAAGIGHSAPRAEVAAPLTATSAVPAPPRPTTVTTAPASGPATASARHSHPAVTDPRPAGSSATAPHASDAPSTPSDKVANAVLQSLNSSRAAHGLAPLAWFTPLERVAIAHTDAMIATHTFGHQVGAEPDFGGRLRQQGVSCSAAGENIASTQDLSTAGAVAAEQHMADERPPGTTVHADNVLNPSFTEVGIAVGIDDVRRVLLITEDFCRP